MKLSEAIKIIGLPLYKDKDTIDSLLTNYDYTSDGKLMANGSIYHDFDWYRSTIQVNRNEIISNIDKGWSYD